ncbi:hypothetical protein [Mucilaginibacter auburnensis]|uniref:Uncharacterized protein n=1 Tax=Mucilaginibacter auburnensis TaxID=1457233 RepID=A0A2H9VSW6_9SPHI|nr:hypothetical protein [Mucilaginibacter auburnensis]PJJ83921.1 hypothetical protein CLV57_0916 [Mucilaginibacter auburnensis]
MARTFYKQFVIISSGIALILTLLYFIVDFIFNDYKSEFITKDFIYPFTFILVIGNALTVAVSALPILLNQYEEVKNNAVISLLSWFLLPTIWLTVILFKINFDLMDFSEGLDSEAILNIINTLPYINVLVVLYFKFRKTVSITIAT